MENNHKKYYKGTVVLGVVLIATFFIYRGTIIAKTVSQNENKTLKEQGLNEYIDPSKNPKYNQVYNEITFPASAASASNTISLPKVAFST
jgi:hypothetical protein